MLIALRQLFSSGKDDMGAGAVDSERGDRGMAGTFSTVPEPVARL